MLEVKLKARGTTNDFLKSVLGGKSIGKDSLVENFCFQTMYLNMNMSLAWTYFLIYIVKVELHKISNCSWIKVDFHAQPLQHKSEIPAIWNPI